MQNWVLDKANKNLSKSNRTFWQTKIHYKELFAMTLSSRVCCFNFHITYIFYGPYKSSAFV